MALVAHYTYRLLLYLFTRAPWAWYAPLVVQAGTEFSGFIEICITHYAKSWQEITRFCICITTRSLEWRMPSCLLGTTVPKFLYSAGYNLCFGYCNWLLAGTRILA